MLKLVNLSRNSKVGACAVTYRSGNNNVYSTCPNTCPLKPAGNCGSNQVDPEYVKALLEAVPRGGVSWTYSHFHYSSIPLPMRGKSQTVINVSTDSPEAALESVRAGYPTVVAVPEDRDAKLEIIDGVKFVRCPAEHQNLTCRDCGRGRPLCARADRDYVIKFTAHGAQKKKVGSAEAGGCYGNGGMVRIQWNAAMKAEQEKSDTQLLKEWVRSLPYGTFVRHHVVGDVGVL